MLFEEIKNIKSEKKDLRNFGLTMGVFFGLLSGLLWWKGKDTFPVFLSVSLCFTILGLVLPAVLRPLQKAWMAIAVIMGWFMTRVILSILFFLVFTPIGLFAKLFGKRFLDSEIDKSKKSYWIKKEQKNDLGSYEKQF